MRLRAPLPAHFPGEVVRADLTGGTAKAAQLQSNDDKLVLLRLSKDGVEVEMALEPKDAERFHTELLKALRWAR